MQRSTMNIPLSEETVSLLANFNPFVVRLDVTSLILNDSDQTRP